MSKAFGIDISFYQEDPKTVAAINFKTMAANVDFMIARAGQYGWSDREFNTNYTSAKLNGIPRGSYWYYDNKGNPVTQAELWLSLLKGDFGELGLWCDFEDRNPGKFGTWQNWKAFIQRLLRDVPQQKIGVYTAYYYWLEQTVQKGIPASELAWFGKYPLWVANYKTPAPLVPKPWTRWTIWQYTDKGDARRVGIADSLNVDENWFNGTREELHTFFNIRSDGDTYPDVSNDDTEVPPTIAVNMPTFVTIAPSDDNGNPIGTSTLYRKHGA